MNGEGRIRQHTDTHKHTMRDSDRDERKKKKKSYYHSNYKFYIHKSICNYYLHIILPPLCLFHTTVCSILQKKPIKIFYNTSLEFIEKVNFV